MKIILIQKSESYISINIYIWNIVCECILDFLTAPFVRNLPIAWLKYYYNMKCILLRSI